MNSDYMITKYERYREQLKQDLRRRIDSAKDYAELFEIVKRVVEIHTGRHRAGLSLILQDMPTALGAYYPVGTNTIVLNRALVAGMRAVSKNDREVNYFVFIVWDIFLKQAFAICAKEFVLQSLDRIIPPLNLQRPIGLKFTLSCKWLEKVAFQTTMRWWTDSMSQALHTLAEENWKSIRTISLTLFHKDRWEGNRFISL